MRNRTILYWLCQISGWGLFEAGNVLTGFLNEEVMGPNMVWVSVSVFVLGISITHAFRWFIHRWNWGSRSVLSLIPRVVVASLCLAVLFVLLNSAAVDLMKGRIPLVSQFHPGEFALVTLNSSFLFLFWNLIYFAVKTFENYKSEQIKNLELRAAKTEIELNSFRAQMNPHFMFNSLNSIRALIDENPGKAKEALTMLSGLLRSNLMLGRNQMVPLREELELVEKYLVLEKIRFEERLHLHFEIQPEALGCQVPPFMLQTIVENGIKHGISKMKEGGQLSVKARCSDGKLCISVLNSGHLSEGQSISGIGLANTRQRLELLFGTAAALRIAQLAQEVVVEIKIPEIKN